MVEDPASPSRLQWRMSPSAAGSSLLPIIAGHQVSSCKTLDADYPRVVMQALCRALPLGTDQPRIGSVSVGYTVDVPIWAP